MKPIWRTISRFLSLVMVCSLFTAGLSPAAAAGTDAPARSRQLIGSIGLTIRFDLPQTAASAAGRDIQLQVSRAGQRTVISLPDGTAQENGLGAAVSASARNADGVELTNETRVGYYRVELDGLPAGGAQYELTLTGTGYQPFRHTVTLDSYSQHVIVGTGDGTFSLGDVTGDGVVDASDLTALDAQLGKTAGAAQLETYDLNGDGKLDVTDLAYINHTRGASKEVQMLDTAAIVPALLDERTLTLSGGTSDDLFLGGKDITIAPAQGSALELPIQFNVTAGVEMSQIHIICPDAPGAILSGKAEVTLANGAVLDVPFNTSSPAGAYAIGPVEGQRLVTIDLGKKVPVKRVTIKVTATVGQPGYATVTKIEFLKDIVPDDPKSGADQVKNVVAVPGNGMMTLSWSAVRNVLGYTVAYGTSANALTQTASTNTEQIVISGLENLKTYYFQVTAVNGDWRGTPSEVISATPLPSGVPGAPSNISVISSDQALRLSWGKTKDAAYYQVFYRPAGTTEFLRFGGDLTVTTTTITGLTNGTLYEVAVKAGNDKGTGPYSSIAAGTPDKESLAMPDLPVEGRIDNSMIQSVVMENSNNVDRSLCPNFTTADVIDNDAATYWVARVWWESSKFTYTFAQPQDMNYAILVPYLAGNYKYALSSYTVSAKNSSGDVVLEQTLFYAKSLDPLKNYLVLTFPMVKGVTELSITLNEREGNGCRVNVSEMAFYKSDTLPQDIAALFTDGTFTALKPGVTAAMVSELSTRLEAKADFYLDLDLLQDELALASALLQNDTSALGMVSNSFQSRAASKDSQYGQSASSLQPLGVTARAGSTVSVYAELPDDAPVYVTPTQFFGESGIWSGSSVRLENGRNYIYVPKIGSLTDERGGPLYLTYAGAHPEAIKVQVRGDSDSFSIPVLELSGWYDMSEDARRQAIRSYVTHLQSYVSALGAAKMDTDIRNATEISTPSVLLSIPANQALNGLSGVGVSVDEMVERMYQNVLAWEDVMYVANQVQGIIPSGGARNDSYRYPMTTRQNIRYMRMFAGAFMYAAGAHIGIGYGSTSGMVCGRPVSVTGPGNANSLFGWGIAHEIGHNMDKLGKAEITNNIYSLAVQAWDGSSMIRDTRLTASDIWSKIYDKTSSQRPGTASNVFVQLGMYWQLHLAYDQPDRPLDLLNRFFTKWKSGAHQGYTYDERVALIASETAGRDLTDFFTNWGMELSPAVQSILSGYSKETRAIWYLNDGSYAYRLNGGSAFTGAVSATVTVQENKVQLFIQGGDASILGYEVRRNGKPVGFTTGSTYTDDLGAANNLTYSYTVVPVDRLGNMGAPTPAVEVRIAYNKTISPTLYTVDDSQAGAIEFTMKAGPVPVTGLKAAGASLSGCTVSVKSSSTADWTPVVLGPVDQTNGLVYFTKPDAAAGDTRIWSYDAAVLRIDGLPAGTNVELLDYPGDRVDLYEGAAVGKLAQDFRYGDYVIAADTLVIIGTYRGDPVYNTIEIQARYNTTAEAQEENGVTSVERAMNGYGLLFAEIPTTGEVSDTSDGFWIFVPDMEAEKALNESTGVTSDDPLEFRAVFYRTDDPYNSDIRRVTSQTLWTSFPETATLPKIALTGEHIQ